MSTKSHRQGGKFKGHTTVIEAAIPVVDAVVALTVVTGLSVGIIIKTKSSIPKTVVSYKPTISGFEMKVRGNKYIQTFFVYVPKSKGWMLERLINKSFPKPVSKPKKKKGRKPNKRKKQIPTAKNFF